MMKVKEEAEFSYKTCPVYLIEYDLEQAKVNLRFAKQNLKNIKEQLATVMPSVTYYALNQESPYPRYIYLRAKSDAEDLVRCKLTLDHEIAYDKAQIKNLKAILKGREAQ